MAKKAAAKKTTKKTAPSAFMKALQPSASLAHIVGLDALARTEVVKKLWVYIKKHKLQDKVNKRIIVCDEKLKAVFGQAKVNMFEMNKLLKKHLK